MGKNTIVVSIWEKLYVHQNIQQKHQKFICWLTMVDSKLTRTDMLMVYVSQCHIITQSHGILFGKSTRLLLVLSLSGSLRRIQLVECTRVNFQIEILMVKLSLMSE